MALFFHLSSLAPANSIHHAFFPLLLSAFFFFFKDTLFSRVKILCSSEYIGYQFLSCELEITVEYD